MATRTALPGPSTVLRPLLADGQWHSLAELYEVGASYVRPECALRLARIHGPYRDVDAGIREGRRLRLKQWAEHQKGIERRGDGWLRAYRARLRTCPVCGHDFWPSRGHTKHCSVPCQREGARRARRTKARRAVAPQQELLHAS